MSEAAISVEGLRKSYGPIEAVRGIDLRVETGEVFAFLGPNGAGKTTTVEILEGYRERDGGRCEVLGEDPARASRAFRERIGVVLQQSRSAPELTVAETVELYAGYYSEPRPPQQAVDLAGLRSKADARIGSLSGGQQRRLDVALALVGDPDLLFLDEPTTGFDPAARRQSWEVISSLKELGKTVFLTTHYMDEAQALADRVAIIAAGVIVAEGSPAELLGNGGHSRLSFSLSGNDLVELPDLGVPIEREGSLLIASVDEPARAMHRLTGWAIEHGVELERLELRRPSLEDVYLRLIEEKQ